MPDERLRAARAAWLGRSGACGAPPARRRAARALGLRRGSAGAVGGGAHRGRRPSMRPREGRTLLAPSLAPGSATGRTSLVPCRRSGLLAHAVDRALRSYIRPTKPSPKRAAQLGEDLPGARRRDRPGRCPTGPRGRRRPGRARRPVVARAPRVAESRAGRSRRRTPRKPSVRQGSASERRASACTCSPASSNSARPVPRACGETSVGDVRPDAQHREQREVPRAARRRAEAGVGAPGAAGGEPLHRARRDADVQ